ncbi:antibiotic biosynthesis monooxygenase family protein [Halioxenophilus sp. WMMB6]|uniref:antibiotic biosynthesis monooxygenase family protein n=1 Tax=Halioxenophilus sp. WMMB6 TaxID=3073815 RepID=UPI00295E8AFB|nr:antibiotic biosynthesis monooxygenase family protein [Halioxenophilus sp. WMMB6]
MKFIFEVTIKPGFQVEEYAAAWVAASSLIQQAPGALGTHLHRHLQDERKLIAIAEWRSKAERDAMEANADAAIKAIISSVAHLCEIRPLGEYADPQWSVLPPASKH